MRRDLFLRKGGVMETKIIQNDVVKPVTPEILAELFAHLDSEKQARFFNHVGEVATDWCWPMQLQYVTEEKVLNLKGRHVMQSIGDYSHWGLSCHLARDIAGRSY